MEQHKWTEKEDNILIKNSNVPREKLAKLFYPRGWSSIQHRMFRLRLARQTDVKRWDDRELNILIEMYINNVPLLQISRTLSRSKQAVKAKAHILGLKVLKTDRPIISGKVLQIDKMIKGNIARFGIMSDNHYGSKYAQITYLHKFYDMCEREGVDFVVNAGDITDGNGTHYPGQRHEMHITGADNLKEFVVKHYPKFKNRLGKLGITYGIAGYHDLDLWVREGYDLLKKVGEVREDFNCLGHASATLKIGERNIQIMHPSGGTAYAISYRIQKIVESFSSENKPHILVVGHFHKAEFIPLVRNVYCFQPGCFQAQTPFAIRKNLFFHYGGWIVEFGLSKAGNRESDKSITHMKAEFIPFYKPIVDDWKNYL